MARIGRVLCCSCCGCNNTTAERKAAKYAHLGTQFLFQPIAVESLGPMHKLARQFLVDLGRKVTTRSGDDGEGSFLFQCISVLLHRFNSVLLHDSFVSVHCPVRIEFHSIIIIIK